MENISIPKYFVDAITARAISCGYDIASLLKKNRIPAGILESRNARLPIGQFASLQQNLTHLMQDEKLGYLERAIPPGTFDLACHSLIHSSTIGAAMERYCRFYQLIERGLIPLLMFDSTKFSVTLQESDPGFSYQLYAYENSLYYLHRFINWLGNSYFHPTQIKLHYARPKHAQEYRLMFFGAPLVFEQENTEIIFNIAVGTTPVQQNQHTLAKFLVNPAYEMLIQNYKATQWSSKVIELISTNLADIPELDQIAEILSLHPQTLRRRLNREGTSFQELKNSVRRDYAIHKLSSSRDSVESIAERTGFSEPSTFIRAFKSWAGITPLAYRKIE